MKLKILSAQDYNTRLKCTIHATGKLGFTEATATRLDFTEESGIKFAMDEDENILYLINMRKKDKESFDLNLAGGYYNVNAKSLFDSLEFDYENNIISFDMIEQREKTNEIGDGVYKLIKNEKPRS